MMPRIQAAETLAGVEQAALSANIGFENELDRQRLLDRLREKAAGDAAPSALQPASPADLAGIGIGIVTGARTDG